MKCKIMHDSCGRMRVHLMQKYMTLEQADILEYYLRSGKGVKDVKVFDRTCDAVIIYEGCRNDIVSALARFYYSDERAVSLVPEQTGRALNREYEDKLVWKIIGRIVRNTVLPVSVRTILCLLRSVKYIFSGLRTLLHGKLEVSVLDATAITVSMIRGDFGTASSVMFLLGVGELLEEWTHKKSVADLAGAMSLGVDKVWLRKDGQELLVPVNEVQKGDCIVVRTGGMIALDGRVVSGEAEVNQSSITGEGLPVRKTADSPVYAGTVVEEGECVICVEKVSGTGRYDRIVKMIEESEKLKSAAEDKASHIADSLVPYSLGATILTYLITGNAAKAIAILMVDFSCALKLAMPISVLSAMRDCTRRGISVKGGKFLENIAEADTIVFDKTGTLTYASPSVREVVAFGDNDPEDMLRLAACLEEHYPHSMANAVVGEAEKRGLTHEERHSRVEYVVAHGISSTVDGEKVVIGSYHFVFEDEKCVIPEGDEEKFASLNGEYSHLYLACGGKLAAVICIEDPLREEAAEVIETLRNLGINKIVMMTGDSKRTAKAVGRRVGVDELHYEVLPEDKAEFIRREHELGRKVIMIGDGVNDSPALSESDAGIAISTGAAIAREIADITISANDLYSLVTLKKLSDSLIKRINWNYRTIIGFNFGLIVLGVMGILPPATSAFLHNASTLAIGIRSMREYEAD
ncbi:heavy metal translocating P-type ATPase [Ruminococcus sp. XPD3002]|uniref:heavy metal translocating P-type ATPase n=1 Tax=Ruminococcus sp. XPD3002 TaxID=1452269 RepID=UPI0009133670|nr:ATPase, P-type (transporting), HAD superfamily, subfamily IC/heavy metal translocating P-type ATPase [Ruminococcus flavefaciens]